MDELITPTQRAFDEADEIILGCLAAGVSINQIQVTKHITPNGDKAYTRFPMWDLLIGSHKETVWWERYAR